MIKGGSVRERDTERQTTPERERDWEAVLVRETEEKF